MRIGSLFSGIGGLEMGLEAALGAETIWQVEQNEYARKVLSKHWPDVDRSVTDVCTASADNLAPVDLVCGGFPCQDISLAGKGAGLDGAKSGLWFEYLRLVRELGPRWVVIENVAALRGRGLDAVLWGLAEAGYDAEWATFGAVDVGAPHRRQRLAIVAHAQRQQLRDEPGRLCGAGGQGQALAAEHGQEGAVADTNSFRRRDEASDGLAVGGAADMAYAHRTRRPAPSVSRFRGGTESRLARPRSTRQHVWGHSWWAPEPEVGRVAHGVPARVDRLRCLGNAVVPQWAYQVGLRVKQLQAQGGIR